MRVKGHRGRLTAEHFLLMRMPERFWRVKFDQIEPRLRGVVRSYLRNLDDALDNGDGLLLWGKNGRGKTSAACYVAKEVRRTGASVLIITAASLIESVLEKVETEDGAPLIDRARTVDFLLLDDLGKEHKGKSSWAARVLETLFRERSANKLSTFITANSSPDGLRERYKVSMMEVLKEIVVPVQVTGDNRRDGLSDELCKRIGVEKEPPERLAV